MSEFVVPRRVLCEFFIGHGTKSEDIRKCLEQHHHLSSEKSELIVKRIQKTLITAFNDRWTKSNRTKERFFSNNISWLDGEFKVQFEEAPMDITPTTSEERGRPPKSYEDLSEKSKKRKNMEQLISSPYSSYAPMHLEIEHNESPNSETVDVKPFIHNSWLAMNTSSSHVVEPNPLSLQNEDNSSYNGFTADESSAYFHFFRGIHSEFLELSPKKQRQFKRKCLDCLHELLDEDDDNHQHGYSYQDNVLNLSNSVHMSEEEKDVKPVVRDGCILSSN
ncbi:uncharacterized protein LOC123666728 [Melitaea cinxia]|uniref:uncharacterized protein LOC123666728 n=1 Tax=Melitaea cinxia TaxID=113334 RepID=UPI001E27476F|nr:uncharacterized protein LOC123666728 [Melitaea cinxia]